MNRRGSLVGAIAALAMTACLHDSPTMAGGDGTVALRANVSVAPAALADGDRTLVIRVFYRQQGSGEGTVERDLPVSPERVTLPPNAEVDIAATVTVAPCLADPQRVPAGGPCRFVVELTLLDSDGQKISSQSHEADGSNGQSVEMPSFILPAAELALAPGDLAFTAQEATTAPAAKAVQVSSVTGAPLGTLSVGIAYASGANWLSASVDQGSGVVSLQPSTTSLEPGSYAATVTVSSSRAAFQPKSVAVSYTVTPGTRLLTVAGSGTGSGTVVSLPAGINCVVTAGQTSGTCSAPFAYGTAVSLSATPTNNGSFQGWTGACTGTSCNVTMTAARSVTARFDAPTTKIVLSRTTVPLKSLLNDPNPPSETVNITNGGSGQLTGLSASVQYAAGGPTGWLRTSFSSTTAPSTLTLTPVVTGLAAGTYNSTVTVSSSVAGVQSQTLPVSLVVSPIQSVDCQQTTRAPIFPPAQALQVSPGGTYYSGATGSFFLAWNLGAQAQPIKVEWDMYGVPDAIVICFQGAKLYDSGGPMSGSGTFTFQYPGLPAGANVNDPLQAPYLYTNVQAEQAGTAWEVVVTGTYVAPASSLRAPLAAPMASPPRRASPTDPPLGSARDRDRARAGAKP